METFFDIIKILCFLAILCVNLFVFVLVKDFHEKYRQILESMHIIQDAIVKDVHIFHSKVDTLLDRAESLSQELPNSPIRPNNWDSIREAFKGPVRVETHERN